MLNPSPQIAGPPGNFINRASRLLLLPLQEGLAKINTQFFVCVERQDPIVNCCGCCKVFLIREIRPFAHNYLGAMGSGNFLCVVLASTVDDDNLVGNPFDGTQSARQVVFLVQRNQTNGETTHHPPESLDSALVSHNRRSADLQQQEARRLGGSIQGWAILPGSSLESSCCRCGTERHRSTLQRARAPLRKTSRWWSPCLSNGYACFALRASNDAGKSRDRREQHPPLCDP